MLLLRLKPCLLLLMIAVLIPACSSLYDNGTQRYPIGLSDYLDRADYGIDPTTILSDLNQGKTDVFSSIPTTPVASNSSPSGSFPWSQSDYLRIASALNKFVWKDDFSDWYLYSLVFARRCQDNPVGFDAADITYYKEVDQGYTTREINIYPLDRGVSWGGSSEFPRPLLGWKSINGTQFKVTADDALQLAEKRGGKDARVKANNSCAIHLLLKPNGDISDWLVFYDNAGSIIFEITIDPYTGN